MTAELFPERKQKETEDEIELYDVSDITDSAVEDAIEFMQGQMKSGGERARLLKELLTIQESENKDRELEKLRKERASIKEAKKKAEEKAALEAQARIDAEQKILAAEAENAKLRALLAALQQQKK